MAQAEIYGELSTEQAGAVAEAILDRTRSNNLAITESGAASGQLIQPSGTSGGAQADAYAISEPDLAAMMQQQAENFAQGGLTGASPIVHQDGLILPPPTELDPRDIGNSPTGERPDLIPPVDTAAGQPVPGSGQGGEQPDISNVFRNPGSMPSIPPHTGAPREDLDLEMPVLTITDAGGGDVGTPEEQIRGKLALLVRGLDGAPVAESVNTLVQDINNGYFNTSVEAKRAIASEIIRLAMSENVVAGQEVNAAFTLLQVSEIAGFIERTNEFGALGPGETRILNSGVAGHIDEPFDAARITRNLKDEFFIEARGFVLIKLPGDWAGWDVLVPGENLIVPPGTAVQNFAGEVSLLADIGSDPLPPGFFLNPADWGGLAASGMQGLTEAVFQNRANQIVRLQSLAPEVKADAILELMQEMGVDDSSGVTSVCDRRSSRWTSSR